ncbi:MAG: T9SS type A sorting domain-containing protein [Flavobacteriales bacterium]|nr:T9SS type A sorting domain-containing protein [Flavobacteriales bacterium]
MNHSIYATINLTVPVGGTIEGIGLVSNKLFNNSSEIEVIYAFSDCSPTCLWTTQVIDENGTIVSTINGCHYYKIVNLDTDGFKLLASIDDPNNPSKAEIYSLPGTIPCESCGTLTGISGKSDNSAYLNSYPNPTNDFTILEYELPKGVNQATLKISNSTGQIIEEFQVDQNFNSLELNTGSWDSGTYFYHLEYGEQRSETKKILVVR